MKPAVINNFNLVAAGYDNPSQRYFPMTGDRIISLLKPRKGSNILDIACGTGAVTSAAAQAIWPDGRVQAIDLAENMLDIANAKCHKLGLDNIDLHNMNAESLDFKNQYFDAVICSFAIFFLDDMLAALQEWQRVLKSGGDIIFTSFAESAFGEPIQIFKHELSNYSVALNIDSVKNVSTTTGCLNLLQQAGYVNVQSDNEQMGYYLTSEHDWWEIVMNSGLRGYIEQLDVNQRADFQLKHLAEIAKLKTENGIWLDVNVLYSRAKKL